MRWCVVRPLPRSHPLRRPALASTRRRLLQIRGSVRRILHGVVELGPQRPAGNFVRVFRSDHVPVRRDVVFNRDNCVGTIGFGFQRGLNGSQFHPEGRQIERAFADLSFRLRSRERSAAQSELRQTQQPDERGASTAARAGPAFFSA